MKKRIALVSYKTCEISAYEVENRGQATTVFSTGNAFEPESNGTVAAMVAEEDGGLSVTVPNGTEHSTIRLSAVEAERLLVALTAHQRLREGCNVDLFKKG